MKQGNFGQDSQNGFWRFQTLGINFGQYSCYPHPLHRYLQFIYGYANISALGFAEKSDDGKLARPCFSRLPCETHKRSKRLISNNKIMNIRIKWEAGSESSDVFFNSWKDAKEFIELMALNENLSYIKNELLKNQDKGKGRIGEGRD